MKTIGDAITAVESIGSILTESNKECSSDIVECINSVRRALKRIRIAGVTLDQKTPIEASTDIYGKVCGIIQSRVRGLVETNPNLIEPLHRLLHTELPALHGLRIADNKWDTILDIGEYFGPANANITEGSADKINHMVTKYIYWKLVGNALPKYCSERYQGRMLNGGIDELTARTDIAKPLCELFSEIEATLKNAKGIGLEINATPERYFFAVMTFLTKSLKTMTGPMAPAVHKYLTPMLGSEKDLGRFLEGHFSPDYAFREENPDLSEDRLLEIVVSDEFKLISLCKSENEVQIPFTISGANQINSSDLGLIQQYRDRHDSTGEKAKRDIPHLCNLINRQNHHGLTVVRPKDVKPVLRQLSASN